MNVASRDNSNMKKWTRRLAAPFLALALVGHVRVCETEFGKRGGSARACAGRTGADANRRERSDGAASKAMETLAARYACGGVNVTVVSKSKPGECVQSDAGRYAAVLRTKRTKRAERPLGRPPGRTCHAAAAAVRRLSMDLAAASSSPDGYIVTNNHVVEGAVDVKVTTSDHAQVLTAKLVGADPLTDLAVLKIMTANLPKRSQRRLIVPTRASVLAFSNVYGFRFTVTRGIVSAINRSILMRTAPGDSFKPTRPSMPATPAAHWSIRASGRHQHLPYLAFRNVLRNGIRNSNADRKATVDELIRDGKVEHGRIGIAVDDVTPKNASEIPPRWDRGCA